MPAEEILERFARDVAPHAMQIPSPRYFGQFNPTALAIGVWADALCSALNQNAGAWRNGPTSALIEAQVIGWLCHLVGYGPEAFGVLASGGSEANLIALKCARDKASREMCERGVRSFEDSTRNMLDMSAVPNVKGQSHLPIIVDPSHATGKRSLVPPLARHWRSCRQTD
jgi:glutamate/tyrosine decarboxylase-like PLP-dependent enzyme